MLVNGLKIKLRFCQFDSKRCSWKPPCFLGQKNIEMIDGGGFRGLNELTKKVAYLKPNPDMFDLLKVLQHWI
ncbi:hypothetical protein A3Q56_03801 [Intoshia linei]|uniref:Uncharacterized protein n=1 Tax=Intoshia linei TaxID=1819745 RepID=A0A177B2F1_9BILA|nr:hypothetical protein A3Q56_03801 [Intoshia linei]